ncbi:MAG: tetratricopeptide repeat protein [Magnetococcales bacterium]|nr:tetratricopeptide repeat protein [Magnetococcales bacterium]
MIHSEIQLALAILQDGEPDTPFRVQLSADGEPLSSEKKVEEARYREVHSISDGCRQLLKSGGNPALSADTLTSAGIELFDAWFAPFWPQTETYLKTHQGTSCHITISSNVADILFLPWELLQFPNGTLPSLDKRFGLRRLPKSSKQPARCCPTLAPGPLKLLFMVSAPTNSGQLDFIAEEQALRQSLEKAGREIFLEVVDSGTVEALAAAIHQFQPHLLHLVGPALIKNETGYFGFEDEIGNADIRSAAEMADELLKNTSIQGVVLSGRDGEKPSPVAALGAVARELAERGTPLALAWGESLTHPLAAPFAETLYADLAGGQTMDHALSEARRAILTRCESSGYPSWILPMLFATTNQSRVYNSSPGAPRIRPFPRAITLPPLPGLDLGPVSHFRLPRRSVQRLLPQLMDGSLQTLLLTGPQGSGKSTLASHLAQNLLASGFSLIALSGSAQTPLTTARVLAAFEQKLQQEGMKEEREILTNPRIGMEDRLGFVAALMNRRASFILILDGLEWSLNQQNNRFLDPTMAPFFFYMLDQMNGQSRFIATSRVTPISGGPAPLPATCREERLTLPFPSISPDTFGLDREEEQALAQLALAKLPLPLTGISALLDLEPQKAISLLSNWQSNGLVHGDDSGKEPVWHLIRPLPEGLSPLKEEIRRQSDRQIGLFFRSCLETNQITPFQRTWLDLAIETSHHFLAANDFELALEVCKPVNLFLEQMGFYWEMEQINRTLSAFRQHPTPLYHIGLAQQRQSHFSEARATLGNLISLTQGKNIPEEALAHYDLAALDLQQSAMPESLIHFNTALAINRAIEDNKGVVACLTQIGMIHMHSGEGEKALTYLEEALEIQRREGTPFEVAQLLPWIGDIYFRMDEGEQAREKFQEALPILQAHQDLVMETQVLHQQATLDLNEERYLAALKGFQASLDIKREMEDQKGEAATFFQLGRLAKAVGHQDSCMRFIGLCYRIDQEIGNPDAEQERRIYEEIVETVGLDEETAKTILEDVWTDYRLDRGQGLIDRTFKKLKQKIFPIIST